MSQISNILLGRVVGILLLVIGIFDMSIHALSGQYYAEFYRKYDHLTFAPIDCLSMVISGVILIVGPPVSAARLWINTFGGAALISFNFARVVWQLMIDGGNTGAVPVALFGMFGTWVIVRLIAPKKALTRILPHVIIGSAILLFVVDFLYHVRLVMDGRGPFMPHSLLICILLIAIGIVAKYHNEKYTLNEPVNR